MGDKKFTLVELHIDNPQLGLGSIGKALPISETASSAEADLESEADESDEESGGKGKSAIGALVALVVLVGLAAAAKKFRGDDESDLEAEEEPDVIVN